MTHENDEQLFFSGHTMHHKAFFEPHARKYCVSKVCAVWCGVYNSLVHHHGAEDEYVEVDMLPKPDGLCTDPGSFSLMNLSSFTSFR